MGNPPSSSSGPGQGSALPSAQGSALPSAQGSARVQQARGWPTPCPPSCWGRGHRCTPPLPADDSPHQLRWAYRRLIRSRESPSMLLYGSLEDSGLGAGQPLPECPDVVWSRAAAPSNYPRPLLTPPLDYLQPGPRVTASSSLLGRHLETAMMNPGPPRLGPDPF